MDALLAAPDRRTAQGQRDYALLLFLYNTGARADEAAQLTIGNLELAQAQTRALSSVRIHGKGNKLRRCPLWPHTVNALTALLAGRPADEQVFLNRCGQPITRFGIHTWLGHVSIDTTNIYAETDLEMKAKALATCEIKETKRTKRWKEDKGLMSFLRAL
jgi:integrase/recombinase XerD